MTTTAKHSHFPRSALLISLVIGFNSAVAAVGMLIPNIPLVPIWSDLSVVCQFVSAAMLALWFTLDPSPVISRLLVATVLAVGAPLAVATIANVNPQYGNGFVLHYSTGVAVIGLIEMLAMNAVLMPLRRYLPWQPGFVAPEAGERWRWSVQQFMIWTAFVAFPLAFVQLYMTLTPEWSRSFVVALTTFVLPVVACVAAGYAVLPSGGWWMLRLLALPAALAMLLVVATVPWWASPGPLPFFSFVQMASGFSIAMLITAVVNTGIFRLGGVRLWSVSKELPGDVTKRGEHSAPLARVDEVADAAVQEIRGQ